MENAIITMVAQIVGELILAAIGIAATWLLIKMGKHAELSNIHKATQEAVANAEETVFELQQTVVERLKADSADGKLSSEEISALNSRLVSLTLAKMSDPTIRILEAAGVDLTALIKSAAEALIARMKAK